MCGNLGQEEAELEQRSEDELAHMGERTRQSTPRYNSFKIARQAIAVVTLAAVSAVALITALGPRFEILSSRPTTRGHPA
jgi:hypothetical protein